jgi:predicted transcriptional regulator
MQILKYFKQFSNEVQFSYISKHNVLVDHIFPPVFMVNEDTKTLEEIQYPKIALLVFKIFNNETNKYTSDSPDLLKSFFTKEPKKPMNQVQTWFTQFEKDKVSADYIEDSPFLCLLKYILSDDFSTNQSDMTEMLKIASSLVKKYLKPIKDNVIVVDTETLGVLFQLISLKVEQDFIKQICQLFFNISLIDHKDIFANFQEALKNTIPEVEEQLRSEIAEKTKENEKIELSRCQDMEEEKVSTQKNDDGKVILIISYR